MLNKLYLFFTATTELITECWETMRVVFHVWNCGIPQETLVKIMCYWGSRPHIPASLSLSLSFSITAESSPEGWDPYDLFSLASPPLSLSLSLSIYLSLLLYYFLSLLLPRAITLLSDGITKLIERVHTTVWTFLT
jgi:hypothetical protein